MAKEQIVDYKECALKEEKKKTNQATSKGDIQGRTGGGATYGSLIRVKINQLAGLILHNSAEFLSCLFLKQRLHPQSSVGVPPSLPPPCFPLHSVRSGLTRRVGGGTCTYEDSLTGGPGAHECVCVCVFCVCVEGGIGWGRLMQIRRSTWSSGCRGESEQLQPAPGGPDRYSDQTRGCPQRCGVERTSYYT